MRLLAALALGSALIMAGCFGGDDEPTDTPTTTTPVTTTPTTGGGGTGGNGTGGGTGGTGGNGTGGSGTTTPPAPKEACTGTANFAAASAPAATTCTIPTGYTSVAMNVTWSATGAGVGSSIKVTLKDADGSPVLSCDYANPTPPTTVGPACGQGPASIPAAGDWTIEYAGTGTVSAAVSVTVS